MGAYLSEPITAKEIETEENELMAVAACSMQGWRVSQEDAHNAILKYDKDSSLFAVYDGHGGHEVAKYCSLKLPDFIKLNEDYLAGKIDKALIDSFVEFDRTLIDRKVVAELKKIAGAENDEEEHDPAEVDHLYQEATMPIEEVVAKYGRSEEEASEDKHEDETDKEGGASSAPKNMLIHPAVAELSKKGRKPISPFLRAKTVSRVQSDAKEDEAEAGNSTSEAEDAKTEAPSTEKSEEAAGPAKEAETEVVKVNGDSTNGHSNEKDSNGDAKPAVNGESAEEAAVAAEAPEEKVVSVKGKGKGKGKSSMASTADAAAVDKDGDDSPKVVPKKKKVFKSAQELYHHVLAADSDGDDEDLDDDDDENFGESGEDEDSDDYEDMDSGEEEEDEEDDEEGDEEEDSEDDDDDDEMNGEIIGGNFNEEPGNDSGCTAVVALIRGTKLFVANAGDSRCIVCRDGKAIEMSADHKPEDQPEMERIEKAGGRVTPDGRVNGGLNLSRALGDHAYKTNKELPLQDQMISPVPDIRTLQLDPKLDSFVFLACDGIWNSLSSQEVADFISERLQKAQKHTPEELKTICVELFEHCLAPDTMGDGTGCDNMTAVLVKLKPEFGKQQVAEQATEESTEAGSSKRQAADDADQDEPQQSKKLKLDSEEEEVTSAAE